MSMTSAPQTAVRTTWTIDPSHTLVEFAAKHMLFTTVKGRFTGVQGSIEIDPTDLSRSSVQAQIDAGTISTGDAQRDGHLRSADFFDAEQYPTVSFASRRVESLDPEHARVVGDLTIHGVTREVVLDVELLGEGKNPWGKTVAGFGATTTINRKDFGLNWNVALETGGWLVGDTIKIALDIQAVQQD